MIKKSKLIYTPFCIILLLFAAQAVAQQSFKAIYKVTQDMPSANPEYPDKHTTIYFTGQLIRKNRKYLYFETPDYLKKYTSGMIEERWGDTHHGTMLITDSVQGLFLTDFDSLITRWRQEELFKSGAPLNVVQTFDSLVQYWTILPDTKTINGLNCQYATMAIGNVPQWKGWFCKDIPMEAGPFNTKNTPGLIMEADGPTGKHYQLEFYTSEISISDSVFWPAEFNEPFEQRNHLKLKKPGAPKTKLQKQSELLKQD